MSSTLYLCLQCIQKGTSEPNGTLKFGQTLATYSSVANGIPYIYCDGCCQMMAGNKCSTYLVKNEIEKSAVLNELQLVSSMFFNNTQYSLQSPTQEQPLRGTSSVWSYGPSLPITASNPYIKDAFQASIAHAATETIYPCFQCLPQQFGVFEWMGVYVFVDGFGAVPAVMVNHKCDICQVVKCETARGSVKISPADKAKILSRR
jgi:hypothetical protein